MWDEHCSSYSFSDCLHRAPCSPTAGAFPGAPNPYFCLLTGGQEISPGILSFGFDWGKGVWWRMDDQPRSFRIDWERRWIRPAHQEVREVNTFRPGASDLMGRWGGGGGGHRQSHQKTHVLICCFLIVVQCIFFFLMTIGHKHKNCLWHHDR